MSANAFGRGFRFPWRRTADIQREVDEEIQYHLERRVADLIAAGMTPAAARDEALRRFGDPVEASREIQRTDQQSERGHRRQEWRDRLRLLVRQSVRQFVGAPALSAVTVATLGLGVGASTALFAMVHRLYLQPLPYPEPASLVEMTRGVFGFNAQGLSIRSSLRQHPAFTSLTMYYPDGGANLGNGAETRHVRLAQVDAAYFDVFGLPMHLGRGFRPQEDTPGAAPTVVLSYGLWRGGFGADSAIIGTAVSVNGVPREVVGVADRKFEFPAETELWVPVPLDFGFFGEAVGPQVVGRLAPGLTPAMATADIRELYRDDQGDISSPGSLSSLTEVLVGSVRQSMWTALAATICILLIGTVNVANLMLVRLTSRRQEFRIRQALGAQRGQVVGQVAGEVAALGLVAGLTGVAVSWVGLKVLIRALPRSLPLASSAEMTGPVLLFAAAITVAIIGTVGLLTGMRVASPGTNLRGGGNRGPSEGPGWRAVRSGLMIVEVAVAFLLVVAAGLFVQSYRALQSVDLGVDARNAIVFDVQLPAARFPTSASQFQFIQRLTSELDQLPGVTAAGATTNLPFRGGMGAGSRFIVARGDRVDSISPTTRHVTPGYFAAIGQPFLLGSAGNHEANGTAVAPLDVVISQTLAAQAWPGEDPVGRTALVPRLRHDSITGIVRIAGVVADVRHHGAREAPRAEMFVPYRSQPNFRSMGVAVRATGSPESLAAPIRAALARLAPDVAPHDIQLLAAAAGEVESSSRFLARVVGAFALVALGLAIMGVHGVVAQSARVRTREFAVRLAIGAPPSSVLTTLGGWALRHTVAGLAIGIVGVLAGSRLLGSLIHGLSPLDPLTLTGVAVLLVGATWLSCLAPARTVRRVAPMRVLAEDG